MKKSRRRIVKDAAAMVLCITLFVVSRSDAQTSIPPASALTLLDALGSALQRNPVVESQQAVVTINRGLQMQAAGMFDTTLQSGTSHNRAYTPLVIGSGLSNEINDTTQISVGESRLFRNGIAIGSTYLLERVRDTYTVPNGVDLSQLSLSISVPLLRGRGRDVVAAQEAASGVEVEASLLDLNQTIAQLITQTVTDYWNVQAAKKLVAITRDAEVRGQTYVDNVTALSRADHVPRSDVNEVVANLADRADNRIAAEQQLITARAQLALDIGEDAADMTSLPEISETFPNAVNQPLPSIAPAALKFYIQQALLLRADVLAARRRIKEASILKVAAANAQQPALNVGFQTGYILSKQGRGPDDLFSATYSGHPAGPDAIGSITFSFPIANHIARGLFTQAAGALKRSELSTTETERSVASAVVVAAQDVCNASARVTQARAAVASFRAALDGEREKYRVGIGSVVDVLTVEDRLTSVLSSEIQADRAYADSIVQFRFLTGTLVGANRTAQDLSATLFSSLPFYAEPNPGRTP